MGVSVSRYWRLLRTYLRGQKRMIAALAALLAAGIAMQLANPQVARLFIDTATGGSADAGRLVGMALLFIGIALAAEIVRALS